ncbi:MAG: lysophospholipid acyltransferase family protein [Anaerolineales bacterium]
MRDVPADSWAARQAQRHRLWRIFWRDIMLRYVGFGMLVNPHITGRQNIPASGPTIIMMNHSFSADGFVAVGAVRPRYLVPMVKQENIDHPLIGLLMRTWGAYGVQRGTIDRDALRKTLDLLTLGEIVLIVPEGTRGRQLGQARDGLAYIALKTNAVIVPLALSGGETWVRDLLIPWRRTPIRITFGPALRLKPPHTGQRPTRDELQAMTTELMYQLAALLPVEMRGQYADIDRQTTNYLEFCDAEKNKR